MSYHSLDEVQRHEREQQARFEGAVHTYHAMNQRPGMYLSRSAFWRGIRWAVLIGLALCGILYYVFANVAAKVAGL